ncbi:hypothetical protein Cri9333_3598 [Crinalium epipsammum PCC 9333]|uniref:Uncharacterized protein n=1 Tax=Crinalium epipsammum PCC 9333 TaxID=1173022 RepID=K9W2G9_9CYAN|nr:hypothetical protein [Crinalium epipsammum]AFZ14421.1 hypothetical protein Cri9333_3598 [Crinalium epipsammum PCC 9333]
MNGKTNRFILLIVACSAAGVLVGGTASWAESTQCMQAELPTSNCLIQNPISKTFEGMSVGLIAGASAAVGATLQMKQEE